MFDEIFYCKLLFALLVLLAGWPVVVDAQIYFETTPDSKFWLEGSSTVHQFDCVAGSIEGTAYIKRYKGDDFPSIFQDSVGGAHMNSGKIKSQVNIENLPEEMNHVTTTSPGNSNTAPPGLYVHLKIPVRSFDCGRSRMNRDMYEALRSDEYDYITFELEHARKVGNENFTLDKMNTDRYTPFYIEGILTVAGVDRKVDLIIQGRIETEDSYRIKGEKKISMQDFNIDPPTALSGLIRAHDEITVFFDLIVVQKQF